MSKLRGAFRQLECNYSINVHAVLMRYYGYEFSQTGISIHKDMVPSSLQYLSSCADMRNVCITEKQSEGYL